MNEAGIETYSINDLSDALIQRKLSSVELTEFSIQQHQTAGSGLNAYKEWNPEYVLKAAKIADEAFASGIIKGPMQGIPLSAKDIYGLPGYPVYAGSRKRLPAKWERSGPVVQSLQHQLCVFMGKTHTVEFAYGGLGVNNNWHTPRNPWDQEYHRVPGGSSSGAGVSLCEGSAFAALGTDTSGSVRIPASYTGNVGLKTSSGRWSTAGIVPLSSYLDTAGILTRTVQDATFVFGAIDSPSQPISSHQEFVREISRMQINEFRIGLHSGIMWESTERSIIDVCMEAITALEADGCEIVSVDFPDAKAAIEMRNKGGIASADLIEFLQSELPEWLEILDPVIRERIKIGGNISAVEYLSRVRQFEQARVEVVQRFVDCDAIVSPTVPLAPPLLSEVSDTDNYMPINLLALQNTTVASFLNLCAITVPVGLDSLGMPVGLQFMAPAGKEHTLLAIGQRLESIVPAPKLPKGN